MVVLITGATGVIGGALTGRWLADGQTRLRLVVRARSQDHLRERVRSLLAFCGVDPADPGVGGRLEALPGDVSRPGLGLEPAVYDRLVREVSHVVHAAGNVKLNQSLDDARRSAVEPTRQIIAFAQAATERGEFRKLEYVSTVGVAGRLPGTVPERPLTEPRRFRNTYEAAKAEAEELVLHQIGRGLPATVYRPSMVVGDSRTGAVPSFQVFYYLCEWLSGGKTWGFVPDAGDVTLDIVPVDYVAAGIQAASRRDVASGRVLHLCSGPDHAIPINELSERLHGIFSRQIGRRPPVRRVPLAVIRAALPVVTSVLWGRALRSLRTLPHFLRYLEEPQQFDNRETSAFFRADALSVPAPESYLDRVLGYYLSKRV